MDPWLPSDHAAGARSSSALIEGAPRGRAAAQSRGWAATGMAVPPALLKVRGVSPDRSMRRSLLAASALVALVAGGCQAQNLAKRELKTEAKVCRELAAVATALEGVAALTPTSTIGQANAANQALSKALEGLGQAEQSLEKLRLQAFEKQLKAFNGDVQRVSANKKLTLEEAAMVIKTKAGPVIAARKALSGAVKCPEPATAAKP